MYDAVADPACYHGSSVLKNLPGYRSQAELDHFEAVATASRFLEPMPTGRWSVSHFQAVHRHIFQDVYRWAGRPRSIRIRKGDSMFCYPEHIPTELHRVFRELRQADHLRGRDPTYFAEGAAHFLADLNAVHAFPDGNGRTQLAFMTLLAAHVGHSLDLDRLEPEAFLAAMIASFKGNEKPLEQAIVQLVT